MATLKTTCDLCKQTTRAEGDDVVYFGEWMTRNDVTVHYYCLLLSTHLPQQGKDHAGILGFLLRDIRNEAKLAQSRNCIYCAKSSATIMCDTCKGYFHITCGFTSMALSQFNDQFRSYCDKCIPLDDVMKKLQKEPIPMGKERCYICMNSMGFCEPTRWIYAKCCGNGYVHSKCIKMYALKAGYYLNCIWCKSKRFRDDVKYLGVFVPDRDANWEREQGAYRDLHRGHQRCDMEKCNCPKGRDYINVHKWSIIICKLCGSFGAHNPSCIPGMELEKERILEFKCETCSATERTICSQAALEEAENEHVLTGINTTLYIHKDVKSLDMCQHLNSLEFSDDSISSSDTVVNINLLKYKTSSEITKTSDKIQQTITASYIPSLTQCDESSERSNPVIATSLNSLSKPLDTTKESLGSNETSKIISENLNCVKITTNNMENNLDKPDPRVLKSLVQRMLDLFET